MGAVWGAPTAAMGRFERLSAIKFPCRLGTSPAAARNGSQRRRGRILARLTHTAHRAAGRRWHRLPPGAPYSRARVRPTASRSIATLATSGTSTSTAGFTCSCRCSRPSAHAHAHSEIVHRDIKPSNVAGHRVHGQVKLLDFGIAKLPPTGQAVGSVGDDADPRRWARWMTTEYCRARADDRRARGGPTATDVYSPRPSMPTYLLLTGRHPAGPRAHALTPRRNIDDATSIVEIRRRGRPSERRPPRSIASPPPCAANLAHQSSGKTLKKKSGRTIRLGRSAGRTICARYPLPPHEPIAPGVDAVVYRTAKFVRRNLARWWRVVTIGPLPGLSAAPP